MECAGHECGEGTNMNRAQTNAVDPSANAVVHRLAIAGARREAIAAVNRLVAARLERNFRYAAALAASCFEHLAPRSAVTSAVAATDRASAARSFACRTAIRASAGFVRKAFAGIKFLFVCGERERASAIDAI